MAHTILAETTASVSELKKNPMGTVAAGEGFPVAILNRNEPAFYCVPAKAYEALMDKLKECDLNTLATKCEEPVAQHRYDSSSEYIRDLIRADQVRRAGDDLRELLRQGLVSGEPQALEDTFWGDLRTRIARARQA